MLAFFEYLRNRAYESIVTGANEALEFLETEKLNSTGKLPESIGPPRKRKGLDFQESVDEQSDGEHAELNESSDSKAVPVPRRRGRPRNHNSGGQ